MNKLNWGGHITPTDATELGCAYDIVIYSVLTGRRSIIGVTSLSGALGDANPCDASSLLPSNPSDLVPEGIIWITYQQYKWIRSNSRFSYFSRRQQYSSRKCLYEAAGKEKGRKCHSWNNVPRYQRCHPYFLPRLQQDVNVRITFSGPTTSTTTQGT